MEGREEEDGNEKVEVRKYWRSPKEWKGKKWITKWRRGNCGRMRTNGYKSYEIKRRGKAGRNKGT